MKRMAIFISTPDSYSDVLEVFLACFHKYWQDCPYDLIISTNRKSYEGAVVYNNYSDNDGWMDRAIPVLSEVDYDYILLMCDDCIILDTIDTLQVETLLNDIIQYDIDFCGLSNHISGKKCNHKSNLVYVKKNKAYAKNMQTGIFKKDYLMKILGDGSMNPWEIERMWLREATQAKSEYFDNIASCNIDILHCKNGVLKGKWYGSTVNSLKKIGILVGDSREIIGPKEEFSLVVFSALGKIIPSNMRRFAKKALKLFGFSFASKE